MASSSRPHTLTYNTEDELHKLIMMEESVNMIMTICPFTKISMLSCHKDSTHINFSFGYPAGGNVEYWLNRECLRYFGIPITNKVSTAPTFEDPQFKNIYFWQRMDIDAFLIQAHDGFQARISIVCSILEKLQPTLINARQLPSIVKTNTTAEMQAALMKQPAFPLIVAETLAAYIAPHGTPAGFASRDHRYTMSAYNYRSFVRPVFEVLSEATEKNKKAIAKELKSTVDPYLKEGNYLKAHLALFRAVYTTNKHALALALDVEKPSTLKKFMGNNPKGLDYVKEEQKLDTEGRKFSSLRK